MTMDIKSEPITTSNNNSPSAQHNCAGCGKQIQDRYLLQSCDLLWHEDCLKCGACDCRLGEVGATLYIKGNLMLCRRDYLRLFGDTGLCAACSKTIPAYEMVMRARSNVYHLECFACQQCNHRFCVGDKFYLCENKILCEYDYEERLVFATIGNHPMLKKHANNVSQNNVHVSAYTKGLLQTHGLLSMDGQKSHEDHNNNTNHCMPGSQYTHSQHLKIP